LIGRFADSYRRRISVLIDHLNQNLASHADPASLRLCVETVDMMLSNQSELARVLHELAASRSDHWDAEPAA
jgi:hypothetical protein